MSVSRPVMLHCDNPECPTWLQLDDDSRTPVKSARAEARVDGWRYRRDSGDFCPLCSGANCETCYHLMRFHTPEMCYGRAGGCTCLRRGIGTYPSKR